MNVNISYPLPVEEEISKFLNIISQSARIRILMVIAEEEACVCHFETVLGLRQASISQHLMVLRKAGLVTSHRKSRNMFYQLVKPEVIGFIKVAAQLMQIDLDEMEPLKHRPIPGCPCPQCNPDLDSALICKKEVHVK